MHADEAEIDVGLVRKLLAAQFPHWADRPITPVASSGTDNAMFRLGDDLAVRLPRIRRAAADIDTEHRWLPRLAPHLPVAIPEIVEVGEPTEDLAWQWSVNRWLTGRNPEVGALTEPEDLAIDLAEFIIALRAIDPTGAPKLSRSGPLADRDEATKAAITASEGLVDTVALHRIWVETLAIDTPPQPSAPVPAEPPPPQPELAQPELAQRSLAQAGRMQPELAQPEPAQPGLVRAGLADPGLAQPGLAPGSARPGSAQSDSAQAGLAQAGSARPGLVAGSAQPGLAQAGSGRLGSAQSELAPGSADSGFAQRGLAEGGSARSGSAQPGLVPGSMHLGSAQSGSAASAQPGSGRPGSARSELAPGPAHKGLLGPGSAQPGLAAGSVLPGSTHSGLVEPGSAESELPSGSTHSGSAQSGLAQRGFAPGLAQAGLAQPGLAHSGWAQSGSAQPALVSGSARTGPIPTQASVARSVPLGSRATSAPGSGRSAWAHGDLSPGNVLIDQGRLRAVIDFGGFGVGDPTVDLVVAWNLLPAAARPILRAALDVDDATWARGRGWALSIAAIQLPYYLHTNPALAANSRYVLDEIVADQQRVC